MPDMPEDCLFCKIAHKQLASHIIYETDELVVFPDIHPKSDVHVLIVPKKHIESVQKAAVEDQMLLGSLVLAAQKVADMKGVAEGYQLLFNVGEKGGQTIKHIHLHLIGGHHLKGTA